MNNPLGFLEGITLTEVAKPVRKAGTRKEWNPSGMGIRVFKDGRVFPSSELVAKFNLEYPERKLVSEEGTKKTYEFIGGAGNGLDFVDSRAWAQYNGDKHFLAIAVVPKDQPKVDLFANTRYDDGKPVCSVLEQGSATFGKSTMINAIKEVYGLDFTEEKDYIDMVVETGFNLNSLSKSGIFLFPKKVSRGKEAGQDDYQRRENVDIFGLVPAMGSEEPVEDDDSNSVDTAISDTSNYGAIGQYHSEDEDSDKYGEDTEVVRNSQDY